MKPFFFVIIFFFGIFQSQAQNWAPVGNFYRPVAKVWTDSLADRLYLAGTYNYFDSTEIHGFGYLHGDTLISLGCGFGQYYNPGCGNSFGVNGTTDGVAGFARYGGELYCTGNFVYAGGNLVHGIAKWGANDWIAVGSGIPGYGNGLKVINNELYAFGLFDSINGISAHGLAKFDGQNWTNVHNFPRFETSPSSPNNINDIEEYKGELYVVGNFYKQGSNPPIRDIVKWNGFEWVAVEEGFYGGFGFVKCLKKFDGKLFIGGSFNRQQNPGSIPGNGITAWDGQSWDTLGGGVKGLFNLQAAVTDLQVHDDGLYAIGYFYNAGDLAVNNVARWDGSSWCGEFDIFDGTAPGSASFYHDTLYVSGGFLSINSDPFLKYCVKWVGNSLGNNCATVERKNQNLGGNLLVYPNPASQSFRVELPPQWQACHLQLVDLAGRMVREIPHFRADAGPVEIGNLAAGIYLLRVSRGEETIVKKLLKQ
ncbi:MAG: T9SS type A sorting domain-containing protein [Bacteroidia bacterium]|nr:T9SS type A sorting domain-containing protein [Bacteroidia bacterium]